jgi:hypothetical protein
MRVSQQTTDYATFESPSGVWGLTRLITGDKSAPSVFQHLLEIIMTGLRPANLLIYIDDLAVIAQTKEEMMEKLQDVFNRLRGAKLRIHPQKSRWFVDRAKYLGFVFTGQTVSPDPEKSRPF